MAMNSFLKNRLDRDVFVIFLHIHKCAGMTFQRLLTHVYGMGLTKRMLLKRRQRGKSGLRAVAEQFRMQDRYFSGHVCFGIHRHLPQPATYISFVREPVSRLMSLYNYSIHNPASYYHRFAQRCTMEQFLLTPKGPWEVDNGMTRFIAGSDEEVFMPKIPFGKVDEGVYQRAVANIESFFPFVGITERYNLSYLIFHQLLGISPQPYLVLNQAENKQAAAQPSRIDLQVQLRAANAWDCKLYEYLLHRLDQQGKALLGDPESALESFNVLQAAFLRRWGKSLTRLEDFKLRTKKLFHLS